MILPGSYALTVLLLVFSLLCWGCWAATFKLAGKWRYELYYFDFAVGMALAALITALTFGSLGWDGFSFLDDIRNSGKRQEMFAFLAGALFNLGNVLLLASVSISGLSVAFPIGLGVAIITGVIWTRFTNPTGGALLLAAGCAAILGGLILNAFGYISYLTAAQEQKALGTPGKTRVLTKKTGWKAVILAIVAGLLLGSFGRLLDLASEAENGLGPYSITVLIAVGVFASTFIFSLFLMNLPLQGQALDFSAYFKGKRFQHALGLLGGMVLSFGTAAGLVAGRVEGDARASALLTYVTEHGAPVVAALCGIFAFKEFADGDSKVKTFLFLTLLLLVAGILLVGLAPRFAVGS